MSTYPRCEHLMWRGALTAPRLSPPESHSTRKSPVSVLMSDAGCPSCVLGVNRQIVPSIVQRWPSNESAIGTRPDRLIAWFHTEPRQRPHEPDCGKLKCVVVHFKCGVSTLELQTNIREVLQSRLPALSHLRHYAK